MSWLTREKIVAAIEVMRKENDSEDQPDGFHAYLAELLTRRFGLHGESPLSQETLAQEYGVSKHRIQIQERRAFVGVLKILLKEQNLTFGAVTSKRLRNILRRRPTP